MVSSFRKAFFDVKNILTINMSENDFSEISGSKVITAIVHVKTSTDKIEEISKSLQDTNYVEDIYLVTGEWDLILKVRFPDVETMKNFLLRELRNKEGIKDSQTSMVISIFKDRGIIFK